MSLWVFDICRLNVSIKSVLSVQLLFYLTQNIPNMRHTAGLHNKNCNIILRIFLFNTIKIYNGQFNLNKRECLHTPPVIQWQQLNLGRLLLQA